MIKRNRIESVNLRIDASKEVGIGKYGFPVSSHALDSKNTTASVLMLRRILEPIDELDQGVRRRLRLSLRALEGCISLENRALQRGQE